MTTIMQKKRARTKEMILNAALELISKQGFEETSMESIAARAEIATGTLYNYYGTKPTLLVALYARLTAQLNTGLPKRLPGPFSCENAINDLIAALQYFSLAATIFPKPITRQIYAYMFILNPDDIAELTTMDMEIMGLIMPILSEMEQAGFLAKDVDIQGAAMLLYGATMIQHQVYIMMPEMSQTQLSDVIEMQIKTQFNGLLVRPEKGTST